MSWIRVKERKYIPLTNERVGEILGEINDNMDVYPMPIEDFFVKKEIFDTICYSIDDYGNCTFTKDDIQISINMELYPTKEEAYARAKKMYFDMLIDGFKDISDYDAELDLLKEYIDYKVDNMYILVYRSMIFTPIMNFDWFSGKGSFTKEDYKNRNQPTIELNPYILPFSGWKSRQAERDIQKKVDGQLLFGVKEKRTRLQLWDLCWVCDNMDPYFGKEGRIIEIDGIDVTVICKDSIKPVHFTKNQLLTVKRTFSEGSGSDVLEIKDMERLCFECGRKHLIGLVCINPLNGMKVPLHERKL